MKLEKKYILLLVLIGLITINFLFMIIYKDISKCQILYKCYNTLDDKECHYKVEASDSTIVLNLTITQFSEVCVIPGLIL